MAKVYTAQEMREEAKSLEAIILFGPLSGGDDDSMYRAIKMLHQAAAAMEREERREKKYEYACKWCDGKIKSVSEDLDLMKCLVDGANSDEDKALLVRREVGEWKEVRDDK